MGLREENKRLILENDRLKEELRCANINWRACLKELNDNKHKK